MIATDEDALICDLAETYGIFDYKSFKPSQIATLASGLSPDSRIRMSLSGTKVSVSQFLAAYAADKLANLVWMLSKDGQNNINRPGSLLSALLGRPQETDAEGDVVSYDSADEFEKAMEKYRSEVS